METAGWYQDPWAADQLRWWDGAQWTGHTHNRAAPARPVSGWARLWWVAAGLAGIVLLAGFELLARSAG